MLEFIFLDKNLATQLSSQLRGSESIFLEYRRWMCLLLFLIILCMGLISAFQMGIIKHLPEPPFPLLNADKVDAAPEAYQLFSSPDAIIGIFSYSVTLLLVAIGGIDRHQHYPWITLLMGTKITIDLVNAIRLTIAQWVDHKAFCFWCLIAATATLLIFFFAIPEVKASLLFLFRKIT